MMQPEDWLLAWRSGRHDQADILLKYIQSSWHNNGFYGFATKDHDFFQFPASDDATGQILWALGYAKSINFQVAKVDKLVYKLRPLINNFAYMRGTAYALLGAVYLDPELAGELAGKLSGLFNSLETNWYWPDNEMTYGNGIIAYALLRYALIAQDKEIAKIGLRILKFIDNQCQHNRQLAPIGNDGWLTKNQSQVPTFSQQPIDAAYMIWAWLAAYQLFNKPSYYQSAKQWMDWFEGDNIKSEKMYDPNTQKCFDGIDESGINYDSGAESNICWLLSRHMLERQATI